MYVCMCVCVCKSLYRLSHLSYYLPIVMKWGRMIYTDKRHVRFKDKFNQLFRMEGQRVIFLLMSPLTLFPFNTSPFHYLRDEMQRAY